MRNKKLSGGLNVVLAVLVMVALMPGTRAAAQTEKVLHNFDYLGSVKDGAAPYGGVAVDASGNLYGMTNIGGTGLCTNDGFVVGCGTVFEVSPKTGGGWSYKILHNFSNTGKDGYFPLGALTLDASGNLYGTTVYGGTGSCGNIFSDTGCGTVFELSPKTGGGWTYKIVHSFRSTAPDGNYPEGNVTIDSAGNLYGTTFGGGAYGYGTVFEFKAVAGGGWTESIAHSFNDDGVDGYYSGKETLGLILYTGATLTLDGSGNLYGVTDWGGTNDYGTIFELKPSSGGAWTEAVVHDFDYTDGANPAGGLAMDGAGNLYGTTVYGSPGNAGTVFELSPAGGGSWTLTQLHHFSFYTDGDAPQGGVVLDASGNLYGTTVWGGDGDSACGPTQCGTVFKLAPSTGGTWTLTVLENFGDIATDGANPVGGLTIDSHGRIFGTTLDGGSGTCLNYNDDPVATCGTVFAIEP
jgi:uncharacterized repeat protein (TIGR03803 family)